MLTKRIIACMDVRNGQVVKGVQFQQLRHAGDPAELAKRYNVEGIDEVVVLDITATLESRQALARTINAVAHEIFLPLTVGGGIRSEDDAAAAIDAGADKVSLNTAALRQPELITTLARRYGSQAVIVAIDAKRRDDGFAVYVRSGTTDAARDAVAWAKEAESQGSGRDPAHVDGSRWDEGRLRLRDDGRRLRRRRHSSDCVGWRRLGRSLRRRVHTRSRRCRAGRVDLSLRRVQRDRVEAALARARNPGPTVNEPSFSLCKATRMLIPSIDLQDGHVVQLVQGERLAIEAPDPEPWIVKFSRFPRVQLIDLDAARGRGDNRRLVQSICGRLPCRVGGGVRSVERAREVLALGAHAVIASSALFRDGVVDAAFARSLAEAVGVERVIAAVDSRGGRVVIHGWKTALPLTAVDAVRALEPFCSEFLYTHVDTEGLMGGTDMQAIMAVRRATSRRVTAAGGITTWEEIDQLDAAGIDSVVGMAIYTGQLPLDRG